MLSLWLPILLATVFVWIASAIAWTVAPHHKTDFRVIPDQDDFMANLGGRNVTPGQYWFPFSTDQEEMQSPEMATKMEKGPAGLLTIWESGKPNMVKPMILTLVFILCISIVVAYMAFETLEAGDTYAHKFQVTGTIAFLAYGGALFWDAIWFGTPWARTWKSVFDCFVYSLLVGGSFAGMWPGG